MNPHLDTLQAYPFEKLRALKQEISPNPKLTPLTLAIGEPQHAPPSAVMNSLIENVHHLAHYAPTKGSDDLRESIATWLSNRFKLAGTTLSSERHILPVNGTREGLFAIAQTCISGQTHSVAVMPNPFYQIYEGASLLAGAKPYYLNCDGSTNFKPDIDSVPNDVWRDCELLFLCTPGNPSGALLSIAEMQKIIELADRHDFTVISDECYSEIYFDEEAPPPGLLQACAESGRDDFARCLAFHSLSKRSNLPGLRSGFVAGDAKLLEKFLLYRTYHGCAMPLQVQKASITAWSDEGHVKQNRELYRKKFASMINILNHDFPIAELPDAGFYLWLSTPVDSETFARALFRTQSLTVLPGSYLSREWQGKHPGSDRARIAVVASEEVCIDAARRIKACIQSLAS